MNPDELEIDYGKMFTQLLDSADDNPSVKEWIGTAMEAMGANGYDMSELMEWSKEQEERDKLEPEPEPEPEEEFENNPEVVCVNNVGLEEYFDEGITYVADYLDSDFFKVYDRFGKLREVLAERFKEVNKKEYHECPDDLGCTCMTSKNPPCTYCESGGWCTEHGEYRMDCGCEWKEGYELY